MFGREKSIWKNTLRKKYDEEICSLRLELIRDKFYTSPPIIGNQFTQVNVENEESFDGSLIIAKSSHKYEENYVKQMNFKIYDALFVLNKAVIVSTNNPSCYTFEKFDSDVIIDGDISWRDIELLYKVRIPEKIRKLLSYSESIISFVKNVEHKSMSYKQSPMVFVNLFTFDKHRCVSAFYKKIFDRMNNIDCKKYEFHKNVNRLYNYLNNAMQIDADENHVSKIVIPCYTYLFAQLMIIFRLSIIHDQTNLIVRLSDFVLYDPYIIFDMLKKINQYYLNYLNVYVVN